MSLGPVMLDIEGLALSPADRDLLREPAVGGVILFSRNFESVEQVTDLVAEIRALRSPPLLIAVDHEGGRVQRFRVGFTEIPPMRHIGREYDRNRESGLKIARQAGWLIASELRAAGIDLSFGPCVDLDWGISEIIGNRSFHRKPDAVSDLAEAFARGLRSAGMAAVAKHFPGIGRTTRDSHLELPSLDIDLESMTATDLVPFQAAIAHEVAGIMISHILFKKIDPEWPASLSPQVVGDLLRKRMGYNGVIITDDLDMGAIKKHYDIKTVIRQVLLADIDIALICHQGPDIEGAFKVVLSTIRSSPELNAKGEKSAGRILELKRKYLRGH